MKFSVKAGFTPNATDEYVIGYVNQKGEKGNPPYVGDDSRIMTRFWQWPKWNKQSLYFISNTMVGEKNKVKTRLYYDTFVNQLFSYDDTTYSKQTRPYAFQSFYDDYTFGGNAEFESRVLASKAQEYNAATKEIANFADSKNNAVNAQIGLFWDINTSHSLKGSVARKTRFATIKDRYSYRMGQAIPNPGKC